MRFYCLSLFITNKISNILETESAVFSISNKLNIIIFYKNILFIFKTIVEFIISHACSFPFSEQHFGRKIKSTENVFNLRKLNCKHDKAFFQFELLPYETQMNK